jgi:hypothetical protein
VKYIKLFIGASVAVCSGGTTLSAFSIDSSNDVEAVKHLERFRKGKKIPAPLFTRNPDGKDAPSNVKSIRYILRACVDRNPRLMHPLDVEDGIVETAVNLNCASSERRFGAIFSFSADGALKKVTFYPEGIKYSTR